MNWSINHSIKRTVNKSVNNRAIHQLVNESFSQSTNRLLNHLIDIIQSINQLIHPFNDWISIPLINLYISCSLNHQSLNQVTKQLINKLFDHSSHAAFNHHCWWAHSCLLIVLSIQRIFSHLCCFLWISKRDMIRENVHKNTQFKEKIEA